MSHKDIIATQITKMNLMNG